MPQEYARVSTDRNDGIRLDDIPRSPRRSDSLSDDSDISYRDNLDDEPFQDEKDRRFNEEGHMEDGDGYAIEPRRVSPTSRLECALGVLGLTPS